MKHRAAITIAFPVHAVAGLAILSSMLPCMAERPSRARQIEEEIATGDSSVVLIAAHRGGYADDRQDEAPENSVANIAVAVRKGYDLYETDIQRTRDGVFVIAHDATLERETDGEGAVADLTLAEVKDLRKRYRDGTVSEEGVATLEEFLIEGKEKILFKADLKPGVIEHFDSLARLIDEYAMSDRVILRTSRKEADTIAECFAAGTPRVQVMFKVDSEEAVRAVFDRFSPRTIQINFTKEEKLTARKRAAIQAAVNLGMLVQTHSYGDQAGWQDLIDAGVRMLHTANPDDTLAWLEQRGLRN